MKVQAWPVVLEHDDIILRPLKYGDERAWIKIYERNRGWLAQWDATSPLPGSSPRNFRDMVKRGNRQAKKGNGLPLAVLVRSAASGKAGQLVGQVSVSNIVYGSLRSGFVGYWISQEYAGRGFIPRAVALVVDYCFAVLRLHRVEINIRPENLRSLRVVEKLGFREEGCRHNYIHIDGQWADHRAFALTAEEVPGGLLNRFFEEN